MSLVELGWRQFTFFEKHTVQDPERPDERFVGLKNLQASCSASGDGFTLFGEQCGNVFRLSRKLEEYFWVAHKRLLADFSLAENTLATVGSSSSSSRDKLNNKTRSISYAEQLVDSEEDEQGINSLVKLWQLDRIEKESPFCLRIFRACPLLSSSRSIAACSVALHSSLQHLAIGFADSSILYCTGDLIKDRSTKSAKWITVVNGGAGGDKGELTGLALAWVSARRACVIFAMTATSVKSFVVANKTVTNVVTHDAKGCSRNLWSFSEAKNQLIVGNTEMVYFYEADQSLSADPDGGKGRCHALGRTNEKVQLIAFQNYVALLTRKIRPTSSVGSPADEWVISVYDVDGQCVAFSCGLPAVSRIFMLDSILMVLSEDGNLAALTEKHISVKLELLFKKNLYDLAVGLAKRSPIGAEYLPEIRKKYGDYLYKSGDFENSVQQYTETIGSLEPSYVIKKFLDGSRIKELCSYLENLHAKGSANTYHTTILLNCYTKMGSKEKIESFIDQNLECEVEAAVQVLRGANFAEEACRLCAKRGLHEQLLAILIEELGKYQQALDHMKRIDPQLVEQYLEKYGKLLLEKIPGPTMDYLIKLVSSDDQNLSHIDAAQLMKMFIGNSSLCTRFIEVALKVNNKNSRLRHIMLELRLRQWLHRSEDAPDTTTEILDLIGDDDLEQAVQLCQMFDFAPGIIYIYTKLEKFDELLEYHMRQNNLKEVIKLCKKKGSQKLWIDAIVFASRTAGIDPDAIEYLLKSVEEANCVHPLLVLEILSRSETLRVAHVKSYIIKWLQKHDEQALNDEKVIVENERKMKEIEEHIESLNYKVQVFQQSKCSACDTSLQLPAVHFLCKHSYHLHCLESYSEKADRCPSCARLSQDQEILSRDPNLFNNESSYKQFQDEVKSSADCMSLVSSYISRGLFDTWSEEKRSRDETHSQLPTAFSAPSSVERPRSFENTPKQNPAIVPVAKSTNPFEESVAPTNPFGEPTASLNPFGDDF